MLFVCGKSFEHASLSANGFPYHLIGKVETSDYLCSSFYPGSLPLKRVNKGFLFCSNSKSLKKNQLYQTDVFYSSKIFCLSVKIIISWIQRKLC